MIRGGGRGWQEWVSVLSLFDVVGSGMWRKERQIIIGRRGDWDRQVQTEKRQIEDNRDWEIELNTQRERERER